MIATLFLDASFGRNRGEAAGFATRGLAHATTGKRKTPPGLGPDGVSLVLMKRF
jgi:hypothetical protein